MLKRLFTLLVLALIFLLLPTSFSAVLRDKAARAFGSTGTYFIRQNGTLFNTFRSLQQIPSLRDDKNRLQNQVVSLQQELATKETVERENQTLRKEVGVTGITKEKEKILAHVILQGSDPLDKTFVIDIGSAEGIKVGQAAITQGSLVGKVTAVRNHSATVRSVVSKESRVQVWISENREKGLLQGDGNSAYLTDITQGIEVKSNAVVETSGLGGSLPQGILVGSIAGTKSKKSDLSQSFQITLALDPETVESLFIVLTDT